MSDLMSWAQGAYEKNSSAQQKYAHQNKVTSQATMWHVQFDWYHWLSQKICKQLFFASSISKKFAPVIMVSLPLVSSR